MRWKGWEMRRWAMADPPFSSASFPGTTLPLPSSINNIAHHSTQPSTSSASGDPRSAYSIFSVEMHHVDALSSNGTTPNSRLLRDASLYPETSVHDLH
ncbi:unnamed protein product [Linum trigynum]|uniref:Uncharacterized protein n=1 Tax=Linum trigynum TaxID=586398 RepID=A0AAV2DD06_9ROSI